MLEFLEMRVHELQTITKTLYQVDWERMSKTLETQNFMAGFDQVMNTIAVSSDDILKSRLALCVRIYTPTSIFS